MTKVLAYTLSLATLLIPTHTAAIAGPVELDVVLGVNAANQIVFEPFDFGLIALDAFSDPPIPFLPEEGFIGDNPGWLAGEEATLGDLLPLDPAANLSVEFLNLSAALRAYEASGGNEITVGEFLPLGGPQFDVHPLWVIDSTSPQFNPNQTEWDGTFRIVDLGTTAYAPSDVHTFRFTTPEPGTLGMLAFAALGLMRSRGS